MLELSLREALKLGHNYIGTEHILLGILREGDGVGAQVLTRLGDDLSVVRMHVIRLAAGGQDRGGPGADGGRGRSRWLGCGRRGRGRTSCCRTSASGSANIERSWGSPGRQFRRVRPEPVAAEPGAETAEAQ